MIRVTVAEARRTFSELLRRVEEGEEVVITRYSREVVRLSPAAARGRFPDMAAFRARIEVPPGAKPTSTLVVEMREKARH